MKPHDVTEHAILLNHERYAEIVDAMPEVLDSARENIRTEIYAHGGTSGQRLWHRLLKLPWYQVRQRMLATGAEGRLLRSNSPFSVVVGISDPEERRKIWRQAKYEISDQANG